MMIVKKTITLVFAGFVVVTGFSDQSQAFHLKSDFLSFSSHAYKNSILPVSGEMNGERAKATIDKMGQKAISFLSNGSLSQTQKEQEFRKLLSSNFDMATIGRFALGKNWKVATQKQQQEYQRLFKNLIVEVYAARFNDYNGQKFDVTSFQNTGKRDITVTSYIIPDNGSKVKIDWRLRDREGQYKIIDVIIEGVSMSLTQRSDFASVIQRGGGDVEVLLAHLRK